MRDLDSLKAKRADVFDATDAQMYDEIMSCCEHGLLREAYIMTWILMVESLRRKICRLAGLEDRRGKEAIQNIEKVESRKKSNDMLICDLAVHCDVIDQRYSADLHYFWQQRCLYAHPYETAPSEQDVRYIITKAIDMVLNSDVTYHKDRLLEILNNEANNPYMIPRDNEGQKDRIEHHLLLTRPINYPALYKELFFLFSRATESKNELVGKYCALFMSIFLETTNYDLRAENSGLDNQLRDYPDIMWFLLKNIPTMWGRLDVEHQDILFNYITITDTKPVWSLRCACKLLEEGISISDKNEKIYYEQLGRYSINDIWLCYVNHGKLLDRIKNEWIDKYSYCIQAKYVEWLQLVQNDLSFFSEKEIMTLGMYYGVCCQNNTLVATRYLENLYETYKTSSLFIGGMITGATEKYNVLYLPENCIRLMLPLVANLPEADQNEIVVEVSKKRKSTPSHNEYFQMLLMKKLDDLKLQMSAKAYEGWVNIVNEYFSPISEMDTFPSYDML